MNAQLFFAHFAPILDFLRWQKQFADIPGFLVDVEGYALLRLAAHGPGCGSVVELGSYLGRSTSFLAAGAKETGRGPVHAVDHFKGSPEHQHGQQFASKVLENEGTLLHQFRANLRRVGLDDLVNVIVASTSEAAAQWSGPIRLLFIDSDHSYEAAANDFRLWSSFIVPGGIVCFHDIGVWPGVTRFYEEWLRQDSRYREIATIASLKVVERLQ